jgi:hypothetical protein
MGGHGRKIDELRKDARLEAQIRLKGIAAIVCAGQPVKSQVKCMAEELGWTIGRTFEVWYGRADLRSFEMDALRNYRPKF